MALMQGLGFLEIEKGGKKQETKEIFRIRVRVFEHHSEWWTHHACIKRLLVFPRHVDERSIYRGTFKVVNHYTKREIEKSFLCFQPSRSQSPLYSLSPISKERRRTLVLPSPKPIIIN